jgi:UDP-GlcNAc:undecaprenyl-phosphate GlcNAc-1-phosphate transferase
MAGSIIAPMLALLADTDSSGVSSGPASPVDLVLAPYIYVFYAAFLLSYVFTPAMRHVALYYRVVDAPDLHRKMHKEPVAYLGGAAVFLGWMGGLAMSQFLQTHRAAIYMHVHWPVSILISAVMIVVLGLADDAIKVNPWLKIAVQVLAAFALLAGGVGTHTTDPLLTPIVERLSVGDPHGHRIYLYFELVCSCAVTICIVVGCCNATNLLDGLDGLCGGVSSIIAFGFVFLAVHMAAYGKVGNINTEGMRIVLALALLGAVLGFVPFNFNPASIFLGDTGSMFIGFCFATLLVMMAEERPKWFLAGIVMFALPILDTALAFVRRIVNRRPIFAADRHHLHHQLLARGFTVRKTVVISYAAAFCFVVLGAAIVFTRTRYVIAAYVVVFGYIIVAAYKSGLVHEKAQLRAPKGINATDPSAVPQFDNSGAVLELNRPTSGADPEAPAPEGVASAPPGPEKP